MISPSKQLNDLLVSRETSPLTTGIRESELIKRPQVSYFDLAPYDPERPALPDAVVEQVEIQLKYEGYIKKQQRLIREARGAEEKTIPPDIDYDDVSGLRIEARQKLDKVKPETLGQAGRISGVSPADVAVLTIYLERKRHG